MFRCSANIVRVHDWVWMGYCSLQHGGIALFVFMSCRGSVERYCVGGSKCPVNGRRYGHVCLELSHSFVGWTMPCLPRSLTLVSTYRRHASESMGFGTRQYISTICWSCASCILKRDHRHPLLEALAQPRGMTCP